MASEDAETRQELAERLDWDDVPFHLASSAEEALEIVLGLPRGKRLFVVLDFERRPRAAVMDALRARPDLTVQLLLLHDAQRPHGREGGGARPQARRRGLPVQSRRAARRRRVVSHVDRGPRSRRRRVQPVRPLSRARAAPRLRGVGAPPATPTAEASVVPEPAIPGAALHIVAVGPHLLLDVLHRPAGQRSQGLGLLAPPVPARRSR